MMPIAEKMSDTSMEPGNWRGHVMLSAANVALLAADEHPEKSFAARLIAYRSVYALCFNDDIIPPTDLDERDEYYLVKRKLERRINDTWQQSQYHHSDVGSLLQDKPNNARGAKQISPCD
jgi:hypothetical protein